MRRLLDYITKKFYLGIVLILLSLVVGNIAKFVFLLYLYDETLRMLMLIVYIVSWPMLFLGIWWAGKDYYDAVKKYFSYKYYHEHMKKGTRKAIAKTKHYHGHVKKETRRALEQTKSAGKKVGRKVKRKVRRNLPGKR